MAQVLVRNIEDETLSALKQRAKTHHRSLESEIKDILGHAAEETRRVERFREEIRKLHARFGGKVFTSSADLIRQDRER